MKKLLLIFLVCTFHYASAQLFEMSTIGTPVIVDFSAYEGNGFENPANAGQLDSGNWGSSGLSDGDMVFGGSHATGDFARGITNGGTTGGGFYAFEDTLTGNRMFWIQPTGSDFTPGELTFRIQNTTGEAVTNIDVSYDLTVLNDGPRANSFDFSFSTDGATFNALPDLAYTSPETEDGSANTINFTANLAGVNIADNAFVYLRWSSDDVLGSGSRDEFGIDNLTITAQPPSENAIFNFENAALTVNEADGNVSILVGLSPPANCAVEVVLAAETTATLGEDFEFTNTTLTFTEDGDPLLEVTVTILEDAIAGEEELIVLYLESPGEGCDLGSITQIVISIEDNDIVPIPVYDIAAVSSVDEIDGIADSLELNCEIRGIVYGINLRPFGLQFTLIDPTGGMAVFSNDPYPYEVTEGDSLHIQGIIGQFRGLTQILVENIEVISSGNALSLPTAVSALDEATEGEFVSLECVHLVDATQWTNSGSTGFTVDISNGVDTFDLRIDNDVDLYSLPAPEGTFHVSGLGGQFGPNVAPFFGGYQLLPRSAADIVPVSAPIDVAFTAVEFSVSVDLFVTDPNPDYVYAWTFGDDSTAIGINASHAYMSPGDYEVCLTATGACGLQTTVCEMVMITGVGIDDPNVAQIVRVSPNPASDRLGIFSSDLIRTVVITNLYGQEVWRMDATPQINLEVPIADLSVGLYFVGIETIKGWGVVKIAKQ